jgi:cytochrome d ubiquinol oxidase subunit II
METIWFCLVAVMLAVYVLLDGFDLGAGAIHLLAARKDTERRAILASIGPVWDGNEVWLLAAGGTMYFAFPGLYAAGFSGFYLALMIVLWLLMLRGLSIEFRAHIDSPLWRAFWDATLCGSSALLAIFYGAALGNVVRGVPLNKDGFFFVALWTNFQPGGVPGIIDWYTVLTGVAALLVLTMHGALWVVLRTTGDLERRARAIAGVAYWAVWAVTIAISAASFAVQPLLKQNFAARPWQWVFPILAGAGLLGVRFCAAPALNLWAFLCSCVFITGLLLSATFGLYPVVLPAIPDTALSLTIHNAAAPAYGLRVGFFWWIPAFLLAVGYSAFIYRHFSGKVGMEHNNPHEG